MSTILIVDDDATIRQTLSSYVSKAGHTPITAQDGGDGLDKFKTSSPKLILLDVVMQPKNGLETLRAIRSLPEGASVAIVMVTSKASNIDKKYAEMNKATDYVTKPFTEKDIHDVLAKYA